MSEGESTNSVQLATQLTIAWLQNQHKRSEGAEVPHFLQQMYETIVEPSGGAGAGLSGNGDAREPTATHKAAVSVRKSLSSPDYIISMIDGNPYRSLRRHLSAHGLTPTSTVAAMA